MFRFLQKSNNNVLFHANLYLKLLVLDGVQLGLITCWVYIAHFRAAV